MKWNNILDSLNTYGNLPEIDLKSKFAWFDELWMYEPQTNINIVSEALKMPVDYIIDTLNAGNYNLPKNTWSLTDKQIDFVLYKFVKEFKREYRRANYLRTDERGLLSHYFLSTELCTKNTEHTCVKHKIVPPYFTNLEGVTNKHLNYKIFEAQEITEEKCDFSLNNIFSTLCIEERALISYFKNEIRALENLDRVIEQFSSFGSIKIIVDKILKNIRYRKQPMLSKLNVYLNTYFSMFYICFRYHIFTGEDDNQEVNYCLLL